MMRLGEGLYTWSRFDPEKLYNFNGFLIRASEGTALIDPPVPSADDEAYLERLGFKPDLIVITNRNHLRGREWFLAKNPAPTAMHEDEVEQACVPVERRLKEGDVLPGGLAVVHLPGKSPGEIALYWAARGLLIIGDALISPAGALKLIPEAKLDDPVLLRSSLEKLRQLEFDVLLLADGEPILRDARRKVDEFLRTLG